MAAEIGANHTGVRLAPYITSKDMADPEIVDTIMVAAEVLEEQEIAYIHLSEPEWGDSPIVPDSFREALRKRYTNTIIVAGRYDYGRAAQILDAGFADLVAFGRPFVANPDLPTRLRLDLPLAEHQTSSLFGGGEDGYTDYPTEPLRYDPTKTETPERQ